LGIYLIATVDGSEIPFPTTERMVQDNPMNNGINYPTSTGAGFLPTVSLYPNV